MGKQVYLQTYGCQMNERDSEEILGMLTAQGYTVVGALAEADVILLNTCSVREHAEARAFGKMGELQRLKGERPDVVLGILGCMAKAQRAEVFRRLPLVDLVAGPAEIYDLPDLLARVAERRQQAAVASAAGAAPVETRVLAIDRSVRPLEKRPAGDYRRRAVTAFVTIMEGCDKTCAYCIVPMTRGREVSRPLGEVLEEVERLARAGYRQVTFLGQNVNAYGKRFPDGSGYLGPGRRERLLAEVGEGPAEDGARVVDFPVLLRQIDARTSIPRVKFTTSHPFDAHERLFRAMAECRAVCESLHLPVQSGSDRVLRRMRRGYTVGSYLAKVARLRELVPEVALSTDIIVGFPGETAEDFEATRALVAEVEYDGAFIFKYSPRPGTEAAGWGDDVPRAVKEARHRALLELQEAISRRKLERWVGHEVE
ncbi:MAG: MiaB/RimO family radical SAM methylthiotransferase, partial [Candidatus Rokubacteria bacterium]|nr:MiaB/RimO family radical SAM methylthiotransferase [Candidatus Rokubacteria bacterium]